MYSFRDSQWRLLRRRFTFFAVTSAVVLLIPSVSFCEWDNITASVRLNRTRPLYNFADQLTFFDASLTNISDESYTAPIRLVIDSVTSPQVAVHNADGLTPDGRPYYDFSSMLGDGALAPGETSAARQVEFYNPSRLRFNFVSRVLIEAAEAPPENQPPTAAAGQDAAYTLGYDQISMTVTLDGSGSADADGTIAQYIWSGTPAPAAEVSPSVPLTAGTYTFALVVVDDDGAQSEPDIVIITIKPAPNRPPTADAGGPYSGLAGQEIAFDGSGSSDPDGDLLTCAWDFGDNSPAVSGLTATHTYLAAGSYTVTLTVDDGRGGSHIATAAATVITSNAPPVLTVGDAYAVDENQLLTFQVAGSDPEGQILTYDFMNLPAGAEYTLAAPDSYLFSWTPTYDQAGTYTVTFSLTDPGNLQDTAVVVITVNNVNRPPTIDTVPEQVVAEGSTSEVTVQAFDPDGETLTLTASDLPGFAGFIDHGDGRATLTLTPGYEDAGNYVIACRAADIHHAVSETSVAIEVSDVNRPPALAPLDDREVTEGAGLVFQVRGSDPDGDVLTYQVDGLPAGALFAATADPNVLTFSWTPTYEQAGAYPVSFSASDLQGHTATADMTITVANLNRPPAMIPVGDRSIKENEVLTFVVSGSDPDDDPLIYAAAGLPPGALFDAALQRFSWTPSFEQAGTHVCRFTVSDAHGSEAFTDVTIAVANVNRAPSLDQVSQRVVSETRLLSFRVSGSDPDGDALTYAASNLPQGAEFDAASQTFSWTPPDGFAGTYQVGFTARDAHLSAAISVRILVKSYDANGAPALTPFGLQQIDEGQPLVLEIEAIDPQGDELTYTAAGLPDGATFDPTGPRFAWTPEYSQAGLYAVNLTARDPGGLSDAINVDIKVNNVNRPPVLDPQPERSVAETKLLTFQVSGSDPDGDDLTYSAGALPAGALFEPASRTFTWTPTAEQAGDYSVEFSVTDGDLSGSATASIRVTDFIADQTPSLAPVAEQEIDEGQELSFQVTANDPNGEELVWTTQGLPGGAVFTPAADNVYGFSWTPTFEQAGVYMLNITVFDPGGLSDSLAVRITVADVNRPPVLDAIVDQQVNEGAGLAFQLSANDPDGDSIAYSAMRLPAGAVLDQTSGAFSWTPTFEQAGSYQITFSAGDGTAAALQAASIEVFDINQPPAILTAALPDARIDQDYNFNISAEDPDKDSLVFTITEAAAGIGIDAVSGELSWRPSHADIGAYELTVQVADGRGGSDSKAYLLAVPDTIPPVVFLNLPKQANPGTSVNVDVQASDNVAVAAVAVGSDRTDLAEPYPQTTRQQKMITLPSQLGPAAVQAFAWDSSGNRNDAVASIEIVADFDTTPPEVALRVPPMAAPGQLIRLTAVASDDVGVAEVAFFAGNETIGTTSGHHPWINYHVPVDAAISSTIVFQAQALDFSGNSAVDEASSTVVGNAEADTTPPEATVVAADTVVEGTTLSITVAASNETCLAQIDVYVNHSLAASFSAPDQETFEVALPAGLEPGMNALVEAVVTDCAGNQTIISADNRVSVAAAGKGLVAGEVYNDRTGLPLEGARVAFTRDEDSSAETTTDAAGKFSLIVGAGTGRITVTKEGFSAVERSGVQITENQGTEIFDARLAPLSSSRQPLASALGGSITTPFSITIAGLAPVLADLGQDQAETVASEISCDIPAGAISANRSFTMTQISPQGLAGILPAGWSPLGALDILPRNISFTVPALLTIPNIPGAGTADGIVLARWDETGHGWRSAGPATVSVDGSTLSAAVSNTGQYVFLLPDSAPDSPPQADTGQPLPGLAAALLPEPITTTIDPQPRVIFYQPGIHSDIGLRLDAGTPLTSGIPLLVALSENYRFYSGDNVTTTPCVQDIFLYSYNRPALFAAFPVTPSLAFESLVLEQGIIDVNAYAPADTPRHLPVVGPAGGTVTTAEGASLMLAEGAVSDYVPVSLQSLAEEDIQFEWPAGLTFVSGVYVDFEGSSPVLPARLSTPLPPESVEPDRLLLVRLDTVQGTTRPILVGRGEVQGDTVVGVYSFSDDPDLQLPGITAAGRYLFVQADNDVGFISGTVFDTTGHALEGAVVTIDSLPVAALSQSSGVYVSAGTVGAFTATALDPAKMDSGTTQGEVPAADGLVYADIALTAKPPEVISFAPSDGQQNVPLGTAVDMTFSEPLDAATVIPANFILTGPAGPVAGSLSLASNSTRVTLRPAAPLATDTAYTFTATSGVQDLAGYSLAETCTFSFTTLDTTPPARPAAGSISATIPGDDGKTTISTTQGTAGVHDTVTVVNKTRNTSTPVPVEADGSFSVNIEADITDDVMISISDPAGNETVVSVGPFRDPDGSIGVGPQGASIEADNGAVLDIPAGAFPNGAIVRFTGLTEAEIGVSPGPKFPFVTGFEIHSSVAPELYLNVSAPLAAGTSPAAAGIVARVVDVYRGQQALAVVDTAKIIDGRLATASPPCPGLKQRAGRYAMFLNEDERMAMAQSLISFTATGMHNVTLQALIENSGGDPENLYEFIAFAGNSGHALSEMYAQTCLPVPPDSPLQVVIRDAETREALDILDIDPIEPFQFTHFHASVYYADTKDNTAPAVIGTNPVNRVLDGYNKRIEIRFSEPIDHMALLGAGLQDIFLAAEDDPETVYRGTWQLSENNTLLVFETDKQLPLGKKFRLHLENIKDLAGNSCRQQPILFTTFKPQVIFPTQSRRLNRADIAAGLGVDEQNIPAELWFKDVDFITRSPDESYDGKWHTTLAAIQGGLNWGGSIQRLFTFDLSDPAAPAASAGFFTDPRFYQSRIRLLDNTAIVPREDAWADPQFWKRRLLYYQVGDPSIRLCIDPAEPDQQIYDQWVEKNCRPEDGGCSLISGGCGDLAVTTVYDGKYSYLWTYDVTNDDEFKWASSRLLSDNGDPRRYEAPAGMGFPQGISVLTGMDIPHGDLLHQNTVGVYVATQRIGLELVDLGLNLPTITDQERESSTDYPWGYAETLQLNAQLYYRDVALVPSRTTADGTVTAPKVAAIASDPKDGTDIKTLEIFRADLAGEPTGIKPLARLPNHLAIAVNIPVYETSETIYYDLALVTTESGGLYIYEIPEDGSAPQKSRFFVDTPAGVVTNYIEVDSEAMLAYVGATKINEITGGDGLLIIDISEPFTFRDDEDGDGWNDRIIGRLPISVSGYAGPVKLNGFRVDRERGLVYAAVRADDQQALVIAKVRNCPDLSIDFKAIPQPAPAPEQVGKNALEQIISAGLSQSGMPAGSVAVLAYGEKACLWKEGCRSNDSNNGHYRFAVLVPEARWEDRNILLAKLYEQVIGPDGRAKPLEILGLEVTFEDIEFIPVKYEEFITANFGLDSVAQDYGLAKQSQLLEWLLTGAYVEGPAELRQQPLPLDLILTLLADACDQGECAAHEPSHVWRQEGFELAKLQEAEFFKSGALIRFHGESETDTTLNAALQKDLQKVSQAAIRAVLARIIANEEGNRLLAFRADTYKGFGPGILTHGSLDPGEWETILDCSSFEHWVASTAARTVQEDLGIFTIEEIIGEVDEFRKVADGEKQFDTAEEANAFIAMAYRYILDVTSGFVWSVYQAKLLDDPDQALRIDNMAALEAGIFELQQNGQKEIRPRLVNKGPENADDIWVRMYEAAAGSGTAGMVKETRLDLKAGSETHPPEGTFVPGGIRQTDPGVNGWYSFLVDIPEKTVREADRENNRINLFFYVLDPADPVVPPLPPEPDLPVEDPQGSLLEGDPACMCRSPELHISVSSGGLDTLQLNPGDCADVDVRVVNTGNEALRNVRLYSTLPGIEDWTHDIQIIGPGEEISATFQYCVPADTSNDLAGYMWFEELDEEYEPPPAESNLVHIEIAESQLRVDAKANGEDEIFVGRHWDVTFSADFDQTNCTNPRYFWDLGDAKGLFNDAGGTYAYDEGGTYRAKVRVTCDEGWEEDIVNVHVVEVEILVNDTLDNPDEDADDGEIDDAVRLKTELPPGHPEGLTTRVFTTPCSVRLKHPLSKDVWVMLMSPEARVGLADAGAVNPNSDTTRQLTLPKGGESVAFAVTGEIGSQNLNDARIQALLEDPGPAVGEEDLTVFWFSNAQMNLELAGVYVITNGQLTTDPSLNPNAVDSSWDPAVWMKAKAGIEPQGACNLEQIKQLRIGIAQAATAWEAYTDYSMPYAVFLEGVDPELTVDVPAEMRVSVRWPENIGKSGWINDGDAYADPLYEKDFDLAPSSYTASRPPAPCPDSGFQFTHQATTYGDSGIWLVDRPYGPAGNTPWPPMTEDPIPVYVAGGNTFIELNEVFYDSSGMTKLLFLPGDAQLVAHLRYQTIKAAGRKENFRDWVVVYWRELPFDISGGAEEVIPLRESEWWLDIYVETANPPAPGNIDPLTHQAQTWGYDIDPQHMPVTGPPYPNQFQPNAANAAYRPVQVETPAGGTVTLAIPQ